MKFRNERKHIVNHFDLLQLRTRLGAIMARDSYAGVDGTYMVKSLYFDNYMDSALREKIDGVNRREKFRIRYYGDDTSFIRLEKKSKIDGMCNKIATRITEQECRQILEGDTEFLLKSGDNLKMELYAKMKYKLLRPKCIVAYKRESFVHPAGHVRVTLDSEICGSNNIWNFLDSGLVLTPIGNTAVLEVKWDEFIPKIVADAVQLNKRRTSAFSKYAAVRI